MKSYRAPRGTTDILPEEQACWRYIEQKATRICQLYGYERIDSPAFEDTSLFTRSVGAGTDIVEKEMYSFTDKGVNQLTLRPEGTAPVCRAYLEHGFHSRPQPVKLYYLAPIFRYERPQAGRYRQHYQFGCEAIGDDDPSLDAENIELAWQFLRSLGLKRLTLQLNSIGCKRCRPGYLSVLQKYYAGRAKALCRDCQKRLRRNLLRLLDCKQPSCQDAADAAPRSTDHLCPQCREHFDQLTAYLDLLKIPFHLNHRLVRGLDYYTRTVFEIQPENGGAQSTICGGGRYDDLIEELGGRPTPAIGFAIGMERVIANLKAQSVPVPPLPRPLVFVAHQGEAARKETVRLASHLRQKGIGVIMAAGNRSLKAQLRQANNLGVHHAVIIGEEELKNGTASLRDMTTAEQKTVRMEDLPVLLK